MITVFTPTYNRAYTLGRLFKSLQEQTCKDFEWIVVDDGSTDNTREICQEFLENATFPMRYLHQENSGKHVAINKGAREAHGQWFFIVDSDDWLPADSIKINMHYLEQIERNTVFAGVSGLRARADGSLLLGRHKSLEDFNPRIRTLFGREFIDATSQDYRNKYRMPGDRAEIIRTNLVRSIPFPSFPGERFIMEYYLWQSISDKGLKIRWFNRVTYCGDYLEDGLTANTHAMMRKNPMGRAFVDNYIMKSHAPIGTRFRAAVNYTRYGRYAGIDFRDLSRNAKNKILFLLSLPIAFAFPVKDQPVK